MIFVVIKNITENTLRMEFQLTERLYLSVKIQIHIVQMEMY